MMTRDGRQRLRVTPWRRGCQLLVLALLVAVPWLSANPQEAAVSRIVLGQLPEPVVLPVSGDTWAFQVGDFQLLHPLAFIENWLTAHVLYLPALAAAALPLLLAVTLGGRVFCSWCCPVGLVLEWNMVVRAGLERLGLSRLERLPDLRYALFAGCLVLALLLALPVLAVVDPPHVLGRELMSWFSHHRLSRAGIGVLAVVLLVDWLVLSRGWCRRLCPSGGGLGLLGRWRLWRLRLDSAACTGCQECDRACPFHLAPMDLAATAERFDWATCDNCGRCRDRCPTGALGYGIGWGGTGEGPDMTTGREQG